MLGLGRDIKHPDGNLLLQYGFERLRPPAGVSGCSQYTLRTGEVTIRLWGFGVYIGREQGIYLNRYEFLPRLASLADAWTPAALARGPRALELPLLAAFLEWVCRYETWVEEQKGQAYRRSVLLGLGLRSAAAVDLAVDWLGLQEAVIVAVQSAERQAMDAQTLPSGISTSRARVRVPTT